MIAAHVHVDVLFEGTFELVLENVELGSKSFIVERRVLICDVTETISFTDMVFSSCVLMCSRSCGYLLAGFAAGPNPADEFLCLSHDGQVKK